jgi:aspartate oxidase
MSLLALLLCATALAGSASAQNKSGTGSGSTNKAPGAQLSPDKQAMLKQMPRVNGRYRSVVRRNLELQQAREDVAKAAAEQKAEADRKEALRKAELRRSAADASRVLKEREQERGERARKQADAPARNPSAKSKPAEKAGS